MMGSLLWPMLAQIAWTCMLYVWLTIARALAVRRGEVEYSIFALGREEPPKIARITRNLGNQFELPVIFYAAIVLLVTLGQGTFIDAVAGWTFVAGRIMHTLVQTLTDDVPLRGRVFMINFVALLVLVAHVALLAHDGIGK
jgi:hypothetical protein